MGEIIWVRTSRVMEEAGGRLAEAIARICLHQGSVRLAIPGGSALEAFGHARKSLGRTDWASLRLTWVDERCVPFSHRDSNRGEAYRRGVLKATDPLELELPLFLEGESPQEACARVQGVLETSFGGGLDLALLGLGEDGHIASLFPGHPWRPLSALVQAVEDSPKPPACRISLSLPLLAAAECILAVSGESKRGALERLLQEDPALPGSSLGKLTVITDLELQTGCPGSAWTPRGGQRGDKGPASNRATHDWEQAPVEPAIGGKRAKIEQAVPPLRQRGA